MPDDLTLTLTDLLQSGLPTHLLIPRLIEAVREDLKSGVWCERCGTDLTECDRLFCLQCSDHQCLTCDEEAEFCETCLDRLVKKAVKTARKKEPAHAQ